MPCKPLIHEQNAGDPHIARNATAPIPDIEKKRGLTPGCRPVKRGLPSLTRPPAGNPAYAHRSSTDDSGEKQRPNIHIRIPENGKDQRDQAYTNHVGCSSGRGKAVNLNPKHAMTCVRFSCDAAEHRP